VIIATVAGGRILGASVAAIAGGTILWPSIATVARRGILRASVPAVAGRDVLRTALRQPHTGDGEQYKKEHDLRRSAHVNYQSNYQEGHCVSFLKATAVPAELPPAA
jgi:hypothetical protein